MADASNWVGHTMQDSDVAAFIRRNGPPIHTKPIGDGQSTLFYVDPEKAAEPEGEFKDYAGEETPPAAKVRVQYQPRHGTHIESRITATARAVSAPQQQAVLPEGNPNDMAAKAEGHKPADEDGDEEATSAARELADENEVDLSDVEGSGQNGRILVSDVEEYIRSRDVE